MKSKDFEVEGGVNKLILKALEATPIEVRKWIIPGFDPNSFRRLILLELEREMMKRLKSESQSLLKDQYPKYLKHLINKCIIQINAGPSSALKNRKEILSQISQKISDQMEKAEKELAKYEELKVEVASMIAMGKFRGMMADTSKGKSKKGLFSRLIDYIRTPKVDEDVAIINSLARTMEQLTKAPLDSSSKKEILLAALESKLLLPPKYTKETMPSPSKGLFESIFNLLQKHHYYAGHSHSEIEKIQKDYKRFISATEGIKKTEYRIKTGYSGEKKPTERMHKAVIKTVQLREWQDPYSKIEAKELKIKAVNNLEKTPVKSILKKPQEIARWRKKEDESGKDEEKVTKKVRFL
jgi:hypothetical protein